MARPNQSGDVSVFTIVVKYHHNGENNHKSLYTYTLGRLLYAQFIILVLKFNVDSPVPITANYCCEKIYVNR